MDIITLIILAIVGGVMIATVAASGIYYSYRSKRDRENEKAAAKITSTPARRTARVEKESYVVYQDESLVDFDSIPVQPETRRPIRYAHKNAFNAWNVLIKKKKNGVRLKYLKIMATCQLYYLQKNWPIIVPEQW